jgi:uncharacterized iron-regulated membrane protein
MRMLGFVGLSFLGAILCMAVSPVFVILVFIGLGYTFAEAFHASRDPRVGMPSAVHEHHYHADSYHAHAHVHIDLGKPGINPPKASTPVETPEIGSRKIHS